MTPAMKVMQEIIQEAREKKCLLQPEGYPDLFFTPQELEDANAGKRFVWGNKGLWVVVPPVELLRRAMQKKIDAARYQAMAWETVVRLTEEVGPLEGREDWDSLR